MDASQLRSLALTHVMYRAGDRVGQLLAYVSLSPVLLFCGCSAVAVYCRELHVVALLLGLLLNEALNSMLKSVFRHPRPAGTATSFLCHYSRRKPLGWSRHAVVTHAIRLLLRHIHHVICSCEVSKEDVCLKFSQPSVSALEFARAPALPRFWQLLYTAGPPPWRSPGTTGTPRL
jgi:hypothetical protein